jgi:2-hydroxychromene-2-carboxylate isomerase
LVRVESAAVVEAVGMKQIDFFYFFGSGYAYLSVMRIAAMAKQSGVAVR